MKGRKKSNVLDRFENKLMFEPNTGCWIWTSALSDKGYGLFRLSGKNVRAHRFSYTLYKGQIYKNLQVCHTCDTPCCVNPDHLFLGTLQDNMEDMRRKQRKPKQFGENHSHSRLTNNIVLEIRSLSNNMSHIEISNKFSISRRHVRDIINRKSWPHI